MKTLLIILGTVMLSLGASAQHRVYYHVYHPRVYISPFSYGYSYGYPFGYPYYGTPYSYGYPYYQRRMPYKLESEIQSIKDDYKHQIREVRKDKSISHSKRRQEIRDLKNERDREIVDAEKNFWRSRRMNHQNNGTYNDRG